jgi:hypothetical protein
VDYQVSHVHYEREHRSDRIAVADNRGSKPGEHRGGARRRRRISKRPPSSAGRYRHLLARAASAFKERFSQSVDNHEGVGSVCLPAMTMPYKAFAAGSADKDRKQAPKTATEDRREASMV